MLYFIVINLIYSIKGSVRMKEKSMQSFKTSLKIFVFILLVCGLFTISTHTVEAAEGYAMDYDTKQLVTEMIPHGVTTGDKADISKYAWYDVYIPNDTKIFILPLKVDYHGILWYRFNDEELSGENIQVSIYSDEECTKEIIYNSKYGTALIPAAGIYYVKYIVAADKIATSEYTAVAFDCSIIDGRNRNLKNKVWRYSGIIDSAKPIYYKVKVGKTGYLTLDIEATYNSYITLCTSTKQPISFESLVYPLEKGTANQRKTVYAVKAGTYYIKVTSKANYVRVRSVFSTVTDTSGISKKKATKLSLGSAKKGLVIPEDRTNKNDWFKFTLEKPTKLNLIMGGNVSSGKINYELTSPGLSGSLIGSISEVGEVISSKSSAWIANSFPKGTYYIRLYKDSKETTGNYTVEVSEK